MTNEETYQHFPHSIAHAYDGHLVDIRNVDYIDMMSAWGSNILGYGYKRVADAASAQMLRYSNVGLVGPEWYRLHQLLIRLVPCAEAVHLVKNGSDATAAAVRLARFVTGREKVLHRGYHGVQDWYMASLGCPGVPSVHAQQIITVTSLDVGLLGRLFAAHPGQIACLIIDPMSWPLPDRTTMSAVRDLVHQEGALLIYDEIVSGFRVAIGGAQELWDVLPDLACYGKCIANGLPLSVLVGPERWMRHVPSINYGLTFSLEVVSIVAALETIDEIVERGVCSDLADKGRRLKAAYSDLCRRRGIESALVGHDCRPELQFQGSNAVSPEDCKNLVIHELARQRVCTYGVFNLCYTHTPADIDAVIAALASAVDRVSVAMTPALISGQATSPPLPDLAHSASRDAGRPHAPSPGAHPEASPRRRFPRLRSLWCSTREPATRTPSAEDEPRRAPS